MMTSELRFVPATAVDGPMPNLEGLAVEAGDARPIGRVKGLVIDLVARRLQYLVVETSRWAGRALRLVPFSVATLDRTRPALRLEGESSLEHCPEFDPASIRPLSGEELVVLV
jgi:hypothetical protein